MPYSVGRHLRGLLVKLHACVDGEATQYPGVAAALRALDAAVLEALPPWRVKRAVAGRPHADPLRHRQNALNYARRAVSKLKARLRALETGKRRAQGSPLTPAFLAKVGLSSPATSARGFHRTWTELVGRGASGVSRSSITFIRDAFVGVVKDMATERLTALAVAAQRDRRAAEGAPGAAQRALQAAKGAPRAAPRALRAAKGAPEAAQRALQAAEGAPGAAPCALRAAEGAPEAAQRALQAAEGAPRAAPGAPAFAAVALLHIHDEAALRLRSSTDQAAQSRSRSSMVQQHVVSAHIGGGRSISVPTEMDALERKTADVLATSLDGVLRPCAEAIGRGLASSSWSGLESVASWLVHILVGDGIGTNEAAAKRLLAGVQQAPLSGGLRYFVLVVRCASHQANLAVASAVSGRAALCGEENAAVAPGLQPQEHRVAAGKKKAPHRNLCGAAVRLFKYLVSDYYEDFVANLRAKVERLEALPVRHEAHQIAVRLARLYGEEVFPPGLLRILNAGVGSWGTCLEGGHTLAAAREQLFHLLRQRVLVVDEHPTLTRMFTFAGHVHGMLLLTFLDLGDLVKVVRVQPRERSQKRIASVRAFLADAATAQYLRRASLAMQMTAHVHNICGQLHAPKLPLLVRLCQGEVRAVVGSDLARLLRNLHLDPDLDVAAATSLLLGVAAELVLRFREYEAYPFRLCLLCKAFSGSYIQHCVDFFEDAGQ